MASRTGRLAAAALLSALAGFAAGIAPGWLLARTGGRLPGVRWTVSPDGTSGGEGRNDAAADAVGRAGLAPPERLRALDGALAAGTGDAAAILLERGRLLLSEARSPTLALADARRLARSHPFADEAASALYLEIRAHREAGATDAALGAARRFLSAFPRSWRAPEAALAAAEVLASRGDLGEARTVLGTVLALDAAGRPDRPPSAEPLRPPARLEPVVLRVACLRLAAGDHASAEGAFRLVASTGRAPDGPGETFGRSPLLGAALVGAEEAALARGGEAAREARSALRSLAARYAGTRAGRRARLLLGEGTLVEKALARAEWGELLRAAAELSRAGPEGLAPGGSDPLAEALAETVRDRSWLDPEGALALARALDPERLGPPGREARAVGRSRALEALGRLAEARAELEAYVSPRLALERAELERRAGDPEAARGALAGPGAGELATVLLRRGGPGTGLPPETDPDGGPSR